MNLFPRFLEDEAEYAQAEAFWSRLWADVREVDRFQGAWRCGWFQPQPSKDGNPIFTAVSEAQRKGIRVIQYEPTCQDSEFDFWFDTFGGEATDPQAIRELVIACALSNETAQVARKLMSWVSGEEIDPANFTEGAAGSLKTE